MDMLDGNTAALRQHEAARDRADKRHAGYGNRVIESIIEKIFDPKGKPVCGRTLEGFIEDTVTFEDVAALLRSSGDERAVRFNAMTKCVEEAICAWCNGDGSDYVAELERDWQESDKADAAESRRVVREAI